MLAKRFELVISTYLHEFAIGSPREVNGQKEHSFDQDVHVLLDFVIECMLSMMRAVTWNASCTSTHHTHTNTEDESSDMEC
jgi:hypothetical protein